MANGGDHARAGERPLVVWRFADGKPGHDNQSRGLLGALSKDVALDVHELTPLPRRQALGRWLRRRYPQADSLPDPDLIVGAGHATHWSMLAARRARGGRVIVLMRPSLPLSWFDLCVIPAHDRPPQRRNVLITQGVLNTIQPGADRDRGRGLILIGGPSRHYRWDEAALLAQVREVIARMPLQWQVGTSRRTPSSTEQQLAALNAERVPLVPWRDTAPDWLPQQLARAEVVWVSVDSVSMVYEALTAGAACGLLELPATGGGRVRAGVESLVAQGMVTRFGQWQRGASLQPAPGPFNEAQRCARWIEQQWLHAV